MINQRTVIMSRMFLAFGLILLVPCAIVMQLVRINFLEGKELRELWSDQAIDFIPIPAQRGNIYDEDGSLLATNAVAYKVAIDPKMDGMNTSLISELCNTLAKHTGKRASYYLKTISRAPDRSRYIVLDKNVSTEAYEALRTYDVQGLIIEEEYQRRYNFETLAAHVLGFVDHKLEGKIGLEKEYETYLKGADGLQQVRRDRNGRIFAYVGAPRKQPKQGHSVYSTIDSHIQAIVEEELKAGIFRTGSNYGSVIVMDPQTGAVKAMANYPTFNPNYPASLENENRRNYAISDMIEPGSTFKLVTAIAAVEQNAVRFNEIFKTPKNGQVLIHGQWMRDHTPLGTLTFPEVIKKSSNVATAEIAQRFTRDTFYQYARNLGFGTPTNIDLPNEETGRLQKPYEWSGVTLPWMAIGYEVQVTPIQLAQAYAAFANRGKMMRPYLVEKVVDEYGKTVWENQPVEVRQIARSETLEKLFPVFKGVVSDSGTAEWVQVPGLPIAGKTGTTQKYINGEYRSSYRASFVGFFPAEDPRYVALVILDEPQSSIYGGRTAGPIFRETAKRIAGLDNHIEKQILKNDEPQKSPWAYTPSVQGLNLNQARALLKAQHLPYDVSGQGKVVGSQKPAPGERLATGKRVKLEMTSVLTGTDTSEAPKTHAIVPDVRSMSMRNASQLIVQQGFDLRIIGSGTVLSQFPNAGDLMKRGAKITIRGREKSLEILAERQGDK